MGAPCRCAVGGPRPCGVGFAGHRFSVTPYPVRIEKNIMSDKQNHAPPRTRHGGAKITWDRQRDFQTQGVTSGLATCGPGWACIRHPGQ